MALNPVTADGAVGESDATCRQDPLIGAHTRLLIVAPHPDDETLATGLLIQQVRSLGGEVSILLLTDGDNNPWPQRWLERRWRIRAQDRQRWGRRRQAEMLQALERLHLPAGSLHALGLPDMGVTEHLLESTRVVVDQVAVAIENFRPTLIVAPSLADHHPDHGAANVMVRLALSRRGNPPPLLTYLVHGTTLGVSRLQIDGSQEDRASKQRASAAHCSQMALSRRRLQRILERPERFCEPQALAQAGARLPWRVPFVLRPWLRLSLVSYHGAWSWRWADAPLECDATGHLRLILPNEVGQSIRFARLAWDVHTPWIFDHWGWSEI